MTTQRAIQTTRFGNLSIAQDDTIRFQDGLVGFPDCREYVLIRHKEGSPFRWLQSIEKGDLAFLVVDPAEYVPDYSPVMPDEVAEALSLSEESPVLVSVIVNIPRGRPDEMSVNLAGPLVVNMASGVGAQVVLEQENYPIRHRIFAKKDQSGAA